MKVQSSTIENKYLRIKSINIGACLYEVYDKQRKINLILNLGSLKNYSSKNFYVGATCGRYAGRISNSKFKIKNKTFKLDGNVFKAVIAVVVASVVSAAMGAYVWASIGEMGASTWTIVFPGWAMGDIVASILGLGVLFSLTDEMKRRGLSVY